MILGLGIAALTVALIFVLMPPSSPQVMQPTSPTPTSNLRYEPLVFRDQVTGCEYLSTHTSATLAPRIAADGKTHMGCTGGQP